MMVQHILEFIRETAESDERLVLVVGQPGSGKSKVMRALSAMHGWEYVDARTLVTEEMLELMPKARAAEAPRIMDSILAKLDAEVVLLDGIQALFAPVLQIDPLVVLKQLSRNHVVVAAWPGQLENGKLIFTQNGRLPCREYDTQELRLLQID